MNALSVFPRSLAALLALFSVGGVMLASVSQEKPMGRVHGRAILAETGKPLAHVKVTLVSADEDDDPTSEYSERGVRRLRAVTDANGEFHLSRVLVGSYHLSAATRAHTTNERSLFVSEDETSDVALRLKRSQPDLQVSQQQREFLPTESVVLPVHGYVDGARPAGTDAIRVRIFRARLADVLRDTKSAQALSRVANTYDPASTLPAELLHPKNTVAPQLLETRTVSLKNADIEGFYHERLKLGTPGAGLYLVEVAHGKNSVCAQMSVSDLALVVKKTRNQLLAYTIDSQSGAPRPNASIRVLQDGKVLTSARTDKEGLATIKLAHDDESGGGRLLSLASFGQNEATVGQYDEGDDDEGHGDFTVHAYTDRPLYRPGGRVSWKGIARRTLDTGIRYSVPVGQKVNMEVRDSSGQQVATSSATTNAYGAFSGAFDLSSEAPSGSYSMVMTIDGEEHTADFSVASYRKPEFSATVTPNEKHYSFGDQVEMMVESTYYFGAPVAGGKAHYTITRAPDWAALYADADDSESYTDEDGEGEGYYSDYSGEIVSEGDVTLDANGHAVIRFEAQQNSGDAETDEEKANDIFSEEPQDQIYTAQLSVTDAAGREVEASGNVPVSVGDFRLQTQTEGYFASPGQQTTLTVAANDFNNKPVANSPIELACLYQNWDSENDKWQEGKTQVLRGTTDAKGIAKIAITPPQEGVWTLRAQTHDSKGRTIIATRTLWIAGNEGGDYDAPYSSLALLTDKKRYKSGETARVLLNAEKSGGTALVTIEGSKLFRSWLVPLTHRSTALTVPISSDYGPNVTLAACTVRDKKFASSEAPLRVEVPQRALRVNIQSDHAKYAPGDKITYQVQTTDFTGKPVAADLSFGVVDESIYALQEDDPGALRRAFYPYHPNSVQTSYSFEPLYLGDVNKAEPNIEARHKFLDTAFWQSDLQTDRDGHASVSFQLPDNLTTWRATAVAQTLDTAFGRRAQKVVVAKDFFVRLETPRFFTGGDHAQVTALVHNETAQEQQANVKIEAEGLTLSGDETRLVSVAPGGVAQVVWPVQTDSAGLNYSDTAHLKLTAWTPQNGSSQFTDGIETQVPVRAHGREHIDNFVGHLDSGGTISQKLNPNSAAITSASRVTVRITPSITDALVGALNSLIGFPYGCTEQTMSRFLPDILVQRTLRLRGVQDGQTQKMKAQLPKMVRDGATRLARFQHESGGWGWWENDDDDPWMTAYVLYGLSQARAEGYPISDDLLSRGRQAGIQMLAKPSKPIPVWQRPNWENTRAFLLYALASASPSDKEKTEIRAVRASFQTNSLDPQALASLVLFDKELDLPATAWTELESQLQNEGDQILYWKGSGYDEWSDWNDKTATAMGLRALVATNPKDSRIPGVLMWMMARRGDDDWGSTRDTAWTLSALCDYLNTRGTPNNSRATGPNSIKVSLNGTMLMNRTLATKPTGSEFVVRVPWQKLRTSGNTLALQRAGSGEPVFYAVQMRQTLGNNGPLAPVTGTLPITVSREYRRILPRSTGQDSWSLTTEPTNNRLNQGDRIRVRLTFNVPRDLSYVLIEDAFPSGCETTERGDAGEGNDNWDYWWSNTDVRDDRIAFFARHMSKGKHIIEYNLRAQTPGTFNALPTMLQAMYDPGVRAESGETSVSVQ
ncbi:putative lipoprotein YfhM [Abditibacteriota bacterium]|nr:putative lipoprotein YfhM [Abditibacteriota bacterium]